ncbi:hypothetical protein Pla163_01390 [Planctomycetes bacterium Pla163]|uniref:Uncharacterized protein n=1 Tax=Rohdeia mirabilis TaxID=2528008 RepID=A0A518CUY9_9BACT|nr:hypothetical protein Pla163_01390 [Planctomycetes bacterium Pla163]
MQIEKLEDEAFARLRSSFLTFTWETERKLVERAMSLGQQPGSREEARTLFAATPELYFVREQISPGAEGNGYYVIWPDGQSLTRELREFSMSLVLNERVDGRMRANAEAKGVVEWESQLHGALNIGYDALGNPITKMTLNWAGVPL